MAEVFALSKPIWELVLRASLAYLALLLLVRLTPKRNVGHISPNDLLTLIVIGGMATNAIMADSTSVGDFFLQIATIGLWAYALDRLEYSVPALRGLLRDPQTLLIENGRIHRRNLRREMITDDELMATLRKEGIEDIAQVRRACMEADGEISIVKASAPAPAQD